MSLKYYYSKIQLLVDQVFKKTTEITAKTPEEALYKGLVAFFFNKGWKTFQGVSLLCSNKLAEDAEILLRSLFEMAVNLTYISKDPLKRARLFLEYDFIQRKELLETLLKADNQWAKKILDGTNPEPLNELEKDYNRVKGNYPDKWRWSGKSIREMCKDVGLELHYASVYWLSSNLAHTNPRAMLQYIVDNENGLLIGKEPSDKYIEKILLPTYTYFLTILIIKNESFDLGFNESIQELLEELKTLGTNTD